ncbi:hypothetical protein DL770_006184 [Monosporascus sp. CRB-9-2]|nr:hypothetical protein DL770_006184 [Monosporascus sp. CRB-9-2]
MSVAAHLRTAMANKLVSRDDDYIYDPDYDYWWDTRTGYIVKWAIFLAFVTSIMLWMIVGRRHAKRRVRAGRKPAFGTGWLLSRHERALVDPRYAAPPWPGHLHGAPHAVYVHYQPGPHGQQPPAGGGWYNMQNMPPPPPVYDANNRPPMYEGVGPAAPAAAGSKVDPNQGGAGGGEAAGGARGDEYAPPAGPPPGAAQR